MSLEKDDYTKAKHKKKIYNVFSEIDYENYTLELIDENNHVFTVKLCDVKLIKGEIIENKRTKSTRRTI